jgi:hypothetical protein
MKVIAVIELQAVVRHILDHLGQTLMGQALRDFQKRRENL